MTANIDVRCVLLRTILLQCLIPVIGGLQKWCVVRSLTYKFWIINFQVF